MFVIYIPHSNHFSPPLFEASFCFALCSALSASSSQALSESCHIISPLFKSTSNVFMSPPHAGPSASPSERYWHACGGPCAGIPEFVYMLPDFPAFSFSLRAWLMCSHAKVRSSEAVTWPPLVPSFAFAAFLGFCGCCLRPLLCLLGSPGFSLCPPFVLAAGTGTAATTSAALASLAASCAAFAAVRATSKRKHRSSWLDSWLESGYLAGVHHFILGSCVRL